ncbi:Hypothetical_protein [Hexamita inflata]|uniref:Hypothetical_protein n=1 Tax=Hexamita inflata TaxID=28002 RepID=A0AA86NRH2_9EUKA|nr:Hypothetical protein HINF_LOCUS11152 [Hexamita inflata]CAI9923511.1 Hypothetical protein HINF_LOCUS11156 [Hexamita inflata]
MIDSARNCPFCLQNKKYVNIYLRGTNQVIYYRQLKIKIKLTTQNIAAVATVLKAKSQDIVLSLGANRQVCNYHQIFETYGGHRTCHSSTKIYNPSGGKKAGWRMVYPRLACFLLVASVIIFIR